MVSARCTCWSPFNTLTPCVRVAYPRTSPLTSTERRAVQRHTLPIHLAPVCLRHSSICCSLSRCRESRLACLCSSCCLLRVCFWLLVASTEGRSQGHGDRCLLHTSALDHRPPPCPATVIRWKQPGNDDTPLLTRGQLNSAQERDPSAERRPPHTSTPPFEPCLTTLPSSGLETIPFTKPP